MFGKGVKLFKLLGFEVRIDASWLLLAVLIIVSLTSGYFPLFYEDLSTRAYLLMGIVGAIGLFASIIIHEMCHSLVGRRVGIRMKGITLFMFGGVAQMGEESQTPKGEFLMSIAGPLASFAIGGIFYVLFRFFQAYEAPVTVTGVLGYLSWINVILALFNLLPAFPLDGGRILRSGLWAWKKNLRWATRIASEIGSAFGLVLIILGIFSLLAGNIIGGLWWCLIGMFLKGIAKGSYREVVLRQTLVGEPIGRFMPDKTISAPANLSVSDLVEEYIYRHHYKMFPVVNDDRLVGCVTTRAVKELPRDAWNETTVAEIANAPSETNTIDPDADASKALSTMSKTGNSRLMVAKDSHLLGVVSLKDLLEFIVLKLDIEGDEPNPEKLVQPLGLPGR